MVVNRYLLFRITALDQIFGYDGVGGYNGLAFSDELFDGKAIV